MNKRDKIVYNNSRYLLLDTLIKAKMSKIITDKQFNRINDLLISHDLYMTIAHKSKR